MNTFVAFDVETTGLKPGKDKVIEIGAVKIEQDKVVDCFSELIDPKEPLSDRIIEITHIQNNMFKGTKERSDVIEQFLQFVDGYPLVGHNIQFDYSFIKAEADKIGRTFETLGNDTLTIARILHSNLKSKNLESMCNYYGICNRAAHRAYYDAEATASLYLKMEKLYKEEKKELFIFKPLSYKIKKAEPITTPQKNYLKDLIKYHKIEEKQCMNKLSKSEASKLIDTIISQYGLIKKY